MNLRAFFIINESNVVLTLRYIIATRMFAKLALLSSVDEMDSLSHCAR